MIELEEFSLDILKRAWYINREGQVVDRDGVGFTIVSEGNRGTSLLQHDQRRHAWYTVDGHTGDFLLLCTLVEATIFNKTLM